MLLPTVTVLLPTVNVSTDGVLKNFCGGDGGGDGSSDGGQRLQRWQYYN